MEDIEDSILIQGFPSAVKKKEQIVNIQKHQEQVRERAKMTQAKAEKERKALLTPEEAALEVKLPDPVEEGKA